MLDEPTSDTPTSDIPTDTTAAPTKAVRRRRATSKPAEAAEAAGADSAAADAPAADAPAETAAPAKRVRKAPAKKAAAPRKRTAKTAAETAPVENVPETTPAEEVPLTEEELAAQAALLQAGEPVVTPRDPAIVDDIGVDALPSAGTDDAPAPAKRTRARRPAAMTFQAPEPVAPAPAAQADPFAPLDDGADDAPTPRRRRRAGTSGAGAPGAQVPELIEPVTTVETPAGERPAASDDDEDDDRPRRRRRGRRGRGPRAEGEESTETDDRTDGPTADAPTTDADADEDDETGTRRRRRRRRTGGADDGVDEAPAAAPVREPRAPRNRSQGGGGTGATSADEDGVRGITGSTRMAAKRVRRQEGRDSGRTRKPILSEAEFLARREAVDRTMVVRQKGDRTQIAVLEDGVLVEHYVTKASAQAYAGNVYLGRVQNVLPSMEAAFVDIGKSRNAVLYAGEVNYNASVGGRSRSIESVLKSGQEVLAQVSKDPIGHKGARLTGQVSLPGRYLVYVPEGTMTGISRKLPEAERNRLKSILKTLVPDEAGVIIRTAAEGASEAEIAGDVRRLQAQWEVLQNKAAKGGAPVLLHAEPDLVVRVVRDMFNEDFAKLIVSGDSEWDTIRSYVEFVAPDLAPRLSRHTSDKDVFAEHRIDEQLLKALDRKVYLPSGGSLVIDRTEAMVVIDVNTGKFVGKGGNLEETVTRNNLEAAEEIARQLRLRDLGGIIVVDFIDMVLESNRDLVVRRLVECLGRDRTKHQVAEVTSLGLVQMTRKRVGQGLLESFSEPCESCNGRGVLVHSEPVDERRGGGGGGGGGGGDEPRRDRSPAVRIAKPLPPDAPKPGAAIAAARDGSPATGEPLVEAVVDAMVDTVADAVAEVVVADDAGVVADDAGRDTALGPKRRRRSGRGAGAATVPASEELAELLSPDADVEPEQSEAAFGESAIAEAEPLEDRVAVEPVEVLSELGDQPVSAQEDAPAPPTAEPDSQEPPGPRRRRRATSRPAGAPLG